MTNHFLVAGIITYIGFFVNGTLWCSLFRTTYGHVRTSNYIAFRIMYCTTRRNTRELIIVRRTFGARFWPIVLGMFCKGIKCCESNVIDVLQQRCQTSDMFYSNIFCDANSFSNTFKIPSSKKLLNGYGYTKLLTISHRPQRSTPSEVPCKTGNC